MKLKCETRWLSAGEHPMKRLILRPQRQSELLPGILLLHGGGYCTGMAAMVHVSRGKSAARRFGAVVISPEYRLAPRHPYPAALEDCYAALLYMKEHAAELGVREDQLTVGGESAGGGLTAALCMYARDRGEVNIAFQMPLYPMLDCLDTDSSANNHGHIWNTRRNHRAWRAYLGPFYGADDIPAYASPAGQTDYSDLPPCYTFVCDGEPFYQETLTYVEHLNRAGIPAKVDVYHGKTHAFDMMTPWTKAAKCAKTKFEAEFAYAVRHYRNPQHAAVKQGSGTNGVL